MIDPNPFTNAQVAKAVQMLTQEGVDVMLDPGLLSKEVKLGDQVQEFGIGLPIGELS